MKRFVTPPIFQGTSQVLLARIQTPAGVDVLQADLSSIILTVRNVADPETGVASSPYTLVIADTVFDTLQTGSRWTNSGGFNFEYRTLNEQVPLAGTTYHFDFWFTPVSGQAWVFPVATKTMDLLSI